MADDHTFAYHKLIDTPKICTEVHPLLCFEYLIHGYIRFNKTKNSKFPSDILSIIEYFYPGYCIYYKPSNDEYDEESDDEFEILHEVSSVCDDLDHLHLPVNCGHSPIELKTLTNKFYSYQIEDDKFYRLDFKTPSNDFIIDKQQHSRIIDNQNQTVGVMVDDWWCISLDKPNDKRIQLSDRNIWKIRKRIHTGHGDLLLTTDGTLYYQHSSGRKGDYHCIPDFDTKMIDIISSHDGGHDGNSALLIDEHHNLWVYGSKSYGMLGIGSEDIWDGAVMDKPVRNVFFDDKKIEKIYCNENRSCVISENGDCYLFGHNLYGQCGNGDTRIEMDFAIEEDEDLEYLFYSKGVSFDDFMVCEPYLLQTKCPQLKIKQAALGKYHTFVLNEDGNIYGFGYNKNKDIIDNELPIILVPTLINRESIGIKDKRERIVKISADRQGGLFIITSRCFSKDVCKRLNPRKRKRDFD